MTLKQAKARYKQVFKSDAPEELSIADIQSKIELFKAEKAAVKHAEPAVKKAKYKARFGVIIEGMGKFKKAEIEANEEVMGYLIEIGSPAVVKL